MFRDIGDKFGLIQAQIGIAKSLARCEKYKDAMEYYRLAVGTCHDTENKVGLSLLSPSKQFQSYEIKIYDDLIAIYRYQNLPDAI